MRAAFCLSVALCVAGCTTASDRGSPVTEVRQPVRTKVVVKVVERHVEHIIYVNVPCPATAPSNANSCPPQNGTVFVSPAEFRYCQSLNKKDCEAAPPAQCAWRPSFVSGGKRTRSECIPTSLNNLIKDDESQ